MKIFFDLPWGGKFEFETRPIDKYVLHSLIWGIVLAIVATAFFGIFK